MADYKPTIFDKIISGEIPSKRVYEDEYVYAFEDINPAAPVHVLIIPRKRDNLDMLCNVPSPVTVG
jgi:histidine triad (HIT) family protein